MGRKGQNEQLIVKANALVEAGHRLSLNEQRIVFIAISKIRRDADSEGADSRRWYTVTATELAEAAGIRPTTAYQHLQNAVEHLWQREVRITGGPNGRDRTPKRSKVMRARWVQAIEYEERAGAIRLMFSEPITPYLTELWQQFTKYDLSEVAPMRSRYGPRLYELIRQWRRIGEFTAEINWLRETWQTPYERIYDVKKKAIEPAIRDVEKHTSYRVSATYKKHGRHVTHVTFTFYRQTEKEKQGRLSLSPAERKMLENPPGKLSDYAG
jgi:plasmid replication initiation protein